MENEDLTGVILKIENSLENLPSFWDGKASILQMKSAGNRQWRQMEWIGFYFQYLCESNLGSFMQIPGKQYGNVTFDGFYSIPWDFKAHVSNSGQTKVIVNDSEAISQAIQDYGRVGLILASGVADYNDENKKFRDWHDSIKGKKSDYVKKRIKRGAPSRRRKVSFDLDEILLIGLDDKLLEKTGSFQKGFRNADGSPRRKKVLLDLADIGDELLKTIKF